MKQKTFIIFVLYIWTKTITGLATKPYLTTREITRNKVLLPVIFSPFISLFFLFIVGRVGVFIFDFYGVERSIIALFLSVVFISITLWQLLLLYLLCSFLVTLRKSKLTSLV